MFNHPDVGAIAQSWRAKGWDQLCTVYGFLQEASCFLLPSLLECRHVGIALGIC